MGDYTGPPRVNPGSNMNLILGALTMTRLTKESVICTIQTTPLCGMCLPCICILLRICKSNASTSSKQLLCFVTSAIINMPLKSTIPKHLHVPFIHRNIQHTRTFHFAERSQYLGIITYKYSASSKQANSKDFVYYIFNLSNTVYS